MNSPWPSAGSRWTSAKQSIYASIGRIDRTGARKPGAVEMASTSKSDGLEISVVVKHEGNHVVPIVIRASQVDGKIIIYLNDAIFFQGRIEK